MKEYVTSKSFFDKVWELAKEHIPDSLTIDYFSITEEFYITSDDITPMFTVDYGSSEGVYIDLILSVNGCLKNCGSIKTLQEGPDAIRLMSSLLGECVVAFWETYRTLWNFLVREGYALQVVMPNGHRFSQKVDDRDLALAGFTAYKKGTYVKESRACIGSSEPAISVKLLDRENWEYIDIFVDQDAMENLVLNGKSNSFAIYQLKDTEETENLQFMSMDYLERKGISVSKVNYDLIYTAPLEDGTNLEDIYTRFNIDHPADFRGHSLSVSDVVVLHQNGENTSHYVDSFGYREVPQFTKELMAEHTQEQTSVIDETTEILSEIAQEHADDEPDRENGVFLVNYNEWREVSTLDFEQNYFAIDEPYGDGDFRLLHLQNQIKDITPAGVHYDTYEEAAAALYEAEREMADMPFNKENNIGSYMVNGRTQLERIMEARQLQKHMDIEENDKVSYYVIADLSTWAENSPERSKLERFDSISEAMEAFQAYRGKDAQYSDDKARITFGVSVHGIEFDVIHVRNNENVLSLDFTHSSEAKESKHFMDDLQTFSDSIGIDKVRVHRDMTPEEVKDFVKRRFEHQLKQGGLDDISLYMSRFDTLYEQGKMEKLMPTANQKHIEENVPITEWDNPYFEVKEPDQMAFSIKDKYVSIQTCTEGYDYSVFDANYRLIDGGAYDNPDISIYATLKDVLEDFGLSEQDERIPVDYEELMEKTEAVECEQLNERIRTEAPEADRVVADFKAKTEELFNGFNGQTQDDVEQTVWAYLQSKIDEYGIDVELVDVVVSGSRCRGLEKAGSDLDVVVEYKGREHEDDLFNAFNEDCLMIGGVKVDINPITEDKTGTLATYLPGVESYLAEKQAMQKAPAVEAISEKTVTLTVAECGEFHSLG